MTARATAEEALAAVEGDPAAACRLAEEALAGAGRDPLTVATAERALGLAWRHLRDLRRSTEHLTRSIEAAAAHGLVEMAGLSRLSLSGNLAEEGRFDEAFAAAAAAAADLDGYQAARAVAQQGTIHKVRGDWHEAIDRYLAALPVVVDAGDDRGASSIHMNLGHALKEVGEVEAAERHLLAARHLLEAMGHRRYLADLILNLGLTAVARGDLPLALERFDEADALFAEFGLTDPHGLVHRAEALLAAGLWREAGTAVDGALEALEAEGRPVWVVEALLLRADLRLAAGDPDGARTDADHARRRIGEQGRPGAGVLADYAEVRARAALEPPSAALLAAAATTADGLDAAGFVFQGADVRLLEARVAARLGQREVADAALARARWARTGGPAWLQIAAWHATAIARLRRGDTIGGKAALRAGLRRVDRHQATLGASDLKARAALLGAELAAAGVRLALADRSAPAIFSWAERLRANGLALRPSRPPRHEELGRALTALRATAEAISGARGQPAALARLRAEQQRLESAVTGLLRQSAGDGLADGATPGLSDVSAALGATQLVEYVESDGELAALVVRRGRAHLVQLGKVPPADEFAADIRFAATRVAGTTASDAARAAAAELAEARLSELDRRVAAPVAARLGPGPLVVVPTGSLHAVPWGALPSLAGRPVSVAPSAAIWVRAAGRGRGGRVVVAAGPRLDHAAAEVDAIAALHPGATVLTGAAATAGALIAAMDGARLVHLAAHGRFRADNPLFSALVLGDGDVYMCDVEQLGSPPEVVVLSACELALAGRFAGDELIGLAAAFLGIGARAVVASTLPVSDRHSRRLMVRFHELLLAGHGPAAALAAARDDVGAGSAAARLTAGSFMCLGRG